MATPQLPEIFLSHSGEQKGFVWNLYRELLHVRHTPFFDQDTGVDSLPKGIPFPPRILQACRACKLGIVVLSHDYIESLWPMLELQQFFFHNPHAPYIFPLFYKLKPADLSKEENLIRWSKTWEEKEASWKDKVQHMHTEASGTSSSVSDSLPMLDISLWPKALERLRSQSGQTLPDNKDELPFIRAIVSNICKILPPPQSFVLGDHFKGAAHIQEKIHELFQQQQSYPETDDSGGRMPISVGLYGVGGSGKTTACKYMLNFYAQEYPGSCWFLQLPSNKNEGHLLVQSMRDFLSQHGNLNEEILKMIKTVEQAMHPFQDLLRRGRVFLVVDNIWDWASLYVQQILAMEYMNDSRLLVTARSRRVLQTLSASFIHSDARGRPAKNRRLLQTLSPSFNDIDARGRLAMQIHHVPSISEAEAIESLKAYSLSSLQGFENADGVIGHLAKSCIFDGQCHPLLLKAVGAKLRHLGGRRHRTKDLENLLSRLQALKIRGDDDDIEEEIVSVLRTSYDALNPKLQNILLLLGTCVPKKKYWWQENLPNTSKWLSMVYNDNGSQSTEEYIRTQIIELEYHGLLQWMDEKGVVDIHDVQMMMIDRIVRENKDAPRRFFFEGGVTTVSESQRRSLKYVFVSDRSECSANILPNGISDVEVLWLDCSFACSRGQLRELHVGRRMQFLRYLHLYNCAKVTEVKGWDGAPNLVSVQLEYCQRLSFIEPMTRLSSLKELRLSKLWSWENSEGMLSTLYSACTALQRCILRRNPHIRNLQSWEGRECRLTALEELSLEGCWNLKSPPDLKQLVKLRRLDLKDCHSLEEAVKVGEATVTSLEELSLHDGSLHLGSCLELPISAFSNLRKLWLHGVYEFDYVRLLKCRRKEFGDSELERRLAPRIYFDLGRISLPPSLEELELYMFSKAQEMPDLSALVNLRRLEVRGCKSLTSMTGLGPLTKLESLTIHDCNALREVSNLGPWSNLKDVYIIDCGNLQILSLNVGVLRRYQIFGCPRVRSEMLPDEVSNSVRYHPSGGFYVAWVRK